ncbi:MAG: DUF4430 domain-containing protein [Eubacteriales bacterium]
MKSHTTFKSLISLLLLVVLTVSVAMFSVSCNTNPGNGSDTAQNTESTLDTKSNDNIQESDSDTNQSAASDSNILGTGSTEFTFEVVFRDSSEKTYTVRTDKTTVGEALVEIGLISGEEGQYGLMVTKVDGEICDYNIDGMYWAFYIDGEYAMTGVDSTEIKAGSVYRFAATKG